MAIYAHVFGDGSVGGKGRARNGRDEVLGEHAVRSTPLRDDGRRSKLEAELEFDLDLVCAEKFDSVEDRSGRSKTRLKLEVMGWDS